MKKHQPWHYRAVLLTLAAAGISMAVAAQGTRLVAHEPVAADVPHITIKQTSDCRTDVAGQTVGLMVGQSIRDAGGWRNCVTYDGHPVIVYSTTPLKSIALASID